MYLGSLVGSHKLIWSPYQEICWLGAYLCGRHAFGGSGDRRLIWFSLSSDDQPDESVSNASEFLKRSVIAIHITCIGLETQPNFSELQILKDQAFLKLFPNTSQSEELFWHIFLCCFTGPKPLGALIQEDKFLNTVFSRSVPSRNK